MQLLPCRRFSLQSPVAVALLRRLHYERDDHCGAVTTITPPPNVCAFVVPIAVMLTDGSGEEAAALVVDIRRDGGIGRVDYYRHYGQVTYPEWLASV